MVRGGALGRATPALLEGIRYSAPGEFVLLKVTQFSSDEHGEDDRAWTAPIWFEAGASPLRSPVALRLRIARLVPNPPGDDELNEEVTIRNEGPSAVSLEGWRLRDLADNLWSAEAVILQAGQERVLRRNRQPLSLNNGGDRLELLDPSGAVADMIEYGPVAEGQSISPVSP
jgi:hypothetical protein